MKSAYPYGLLNFDCIVRTDCVSYERTSAAGFVLTSRLSYYAHTYSVIEVRQPRNLYRSAAHVQAHHACHCLHFGDVLPTIGGSLPAVTPRASSRGPFGPARICIRLSRFNRSIDRCAKHRPKPVRPSTPSDRLQHWHTVTRGAHRYRNARPRAHRISSALESSDRNNPLGGCHLEQTN